MHLNRTGAGTTTTFYKTQLVSKDRAPCRMHVENGENARCKITMLILSRHDTLWWANMWHGNRYEKHGMIRRLNDDRS